MNRKSNSTMINEIKISSSESLTNPKDITDSLNKHFIEIGHKLASEIPDPCNEKVLRHICYVPLRSLSFKRLRNRRF